MDHRFYDLHVRFSENWEEIIKRAEYIGLSGVCLVVSSKEDLRNYFNVVKEIKKNTSLDVVEGILIEEENDNIVKFAKKYRKEFELVLVKGGDYEINRSACSCEYVDILSVPGQGRKDSGIDHICLRDAKEKGVLIELKFNELLRAQGMDKIREIKKMKEIIRLCTKMKAHFIVNSGAENKWELRQGRDLSSLSYCLGANQEEALYSDYAEKLIQKNREKISQPLKGVEIRGDLKDYER